MTTEAAAAAPLATPDTAGAPPVDSGAAAPAAPPDTKASDAKADEKPEKAEGKPKAKDYVELRKEKQKLAERAAKIEEREKALGMQDARLAEVRKQFVSDPLGFLERIAEESGTALHTVVEELNKRVLAGGKRAPEDATKAELAAIKAKLEETEKREREREQTAKQLQREREAGDAVDKLSKGYERVSAFPRERVVAAVLRTIEDHTGSKPLAYADALGMLEEELARIESALPSRASGAGNRPAKPEAVATKGEKPPSTTLSNNLAVAGVGAPDEEEDLPPWQWARKQAQRLVRGA